MTINNLRSAAQTMRECDTALENTITRLREAYQVAHDKAMRLQDSSDKVYYAELGRAAGIAIALQIVLATP